MGQDFVEYIREHHDPLDIVLGLARKYGTVLLNGSGFDGPPWAARVSLANLDTDDYAAIGQHLKEVAETAVTRWKASRAATSGKKGE